MADSIAPTRKPVSPKPTLNSWDPPELLGSYVMYIYIYICTCIDIQ